MITLPVSYLPVPYFRQIGATANEHNEDCLAACVAAVAGAFNKPYPRRTVNQVYNDMQATGDVGLLIEQGQAWLAGQGIQNDLLYLPDIHSIFDLMAQQRPFISLIHCAPLRAAGLMQFNYDLAHFVVGVWVDPKYVYIHEPYRSEDNMGGFALPVPIGIFMQACKDAILDFHNPQYAAIVTRLSIRDLTGPIPAYADYEVVPAAIYVRTGPAQTTPLYATKPTISQETIVHLVSPIPTGGYVQIVDAKKYNAVTKVWDIVPVAGEWVWLDYLKLTT